MIELYFYFYYFIFISIISCILAIFWDTKSIPDFIVKISFLALCVNGTILTVNSIQPNTLRELLSFEQFNWVVLILMGILGFTWSKRNIINILIKTMLFISAIISGLLIYSEL